MRRELVSRNANEWKSTTQQMQQMETKTNGVGPSQPIDITEGKGAG